MISRIMKSWNQSSLISPNASTPTVKTRSTRYTHTSSTCHGKLGWGQDKRLIEFFESKEEKLTPNLLDGDYYLYENRDARYFFIKFPGHSYIPPHVQNVSTSTSQIPPAPPEAPAKPIFVVSLSPSLRLSALTCLQVELSPPISIRTHWVPTWTQMRHPNFNFVCVTLFAM